MAAVSGHAEIVNLLLKKGADYMAMDKNDKSAIFLAAEEDKVEALKVRCWSDVGCGIYTLQNSSYRKTSIVNMQ